MSNALDQLARNLDANLKPNPYVLEFIALIKPYFPPTSPSLRTIQFIFRSIPLFTLVQWTPLSRYQAMGRTSSSSTSDFNLAGRTAWCIAELIGPLNLLFVLYTLPARLGPLSSTSTTITNNGIFGTGLPLTHEIMGGLYLLHYLNRAIITPLFLAPSMSPIHLLVASLMATFQFLNSSSIAGWICYDAQRQSLLFTSAHSFLLNPLSILGMLLFMTGLTGNILSENTLFSLRRGAAKRKAKSEGKAQVSYDKVYVIPPAEGLFKRILYPHYSFEWLEWMGYWVLGGAWGMGWGWSRSAALMFVVNEVATMTPRAVQGIKWYEEKFGKKAVGGRKAVIPGLL